MNLLEIETASIPPQRLKINLNSVVSIAPNENGHYEICLNNLSRYTVTESYAQFIETASSGEQPFDVRQLCEITDFHRKRSQQIAADDDANWTNVP